MTMEIIRANVKRALVERIKSLASMPYQRDLAALHSLSEQEFWGYQATRFSRVYEDAIAHVPYYRDLQDQYPRQIHKCEDPRQMLKELPVLEKAVVKTETQRFWRQPALFGTAEHTTGGTSGNPLRVRAAIAERGFTQAILADRYQHIVGTRSPRILRMSGYLARGIEPDSIFQPIPGGKYGYLSIYSLTHSNRGRIVDVLDTFRPQVIHGYASAIHQLALLFTEIPLPSTVEPFVVVTTSETTSPRQRDDIERYLRTKVFDEYGSQEGQHLVIECARGTKHIHPARGIVEILAMNSNEPATPGSVGRVVVTGLMNRTMPLLRYDLGDTAVATGYATNCECGLSWPSIGTVYGRIEDLVQTRDGRKIGLLSHSTLKDLDGIKESQIVQTNLGEFVYRIVPQDPSSVDKSTIEGHVTKELQNRLQESVTVVFEYPDEIEKTLSGKHQAVVVRLKGK